MVDLSLLKKGMLVTLSNQDVLEVIGIDKFSRDNTTFYHVHFNKKVKPNVGLKAAKSIFFNRDGSYHSAYGYSRVIAATAAVCIYVVSFRKKPDNPPAEPQKLALKEQVQQLFGVPTPEPKEETIEDNLGSAWDAEMYEHLQDINITSFKDLSSPDIIRTVDGKIYRFSKEYSVERKEHLFSFAEITITDVDFNL